MLAIGFAHFAVAAWWREWVRKRQERHNAIFEGQVIPTHESTNEVVAERGRQEESQTYIDVKIRQPAGRTQEILSNI